METTMQIKQSYIQHIKGHKNSQGENAPWVIKDHDTDKILSSHKTREEAEKHLKQMKFFKHKKSTTNLDENVITSNFIIKKISDNTSIGSFKIDEYFDEDNNEFLCAVHDIHILDDDYKDMRPELKELEEFSSLDWRTLRSFLKTILAAYQLYYEEQL